MATKQNPGAHPPNYLFLCTGPNCGERGGTDLADRMKQHLTDQGRLGAAFVVPCFCFGQCPTGPNACSLKHPELLTGLSPDQAEEVIERLMS
ncbi:MAG: (2Fe-2S) ferredoxin domain-containing protein [Planctomycetota bacterium]